MTRPGEVPRYDTGSCNTHSSAHGGVATSRARHSARHGRACTATLPGQACKKAQCTRSVRAGWAKVCTWCTRLSFDSMHCSESLFGTLFMNTVHEHCSQGFQKNNNNKIK